MKTLKPKTIIIILTALVALVSFWAFVNRYLYKPKAAAEKINVTFAPTSGDFKVGEKKTLDIIIQTTVSTKKISGLDLSFAASGSLSILGMTPPAPYPQIDQSKLSQTQVLYDVKEKQARIVYVFSNPDEQLPTALILKVDFQGTANGSGGLKLEAGKSQIVGNISGGLYEFGSVSQANFNFSGTPLSPTPSTISKWISKTPTPSICGKQFSGKPTEQEIAACQQAGGIIFNTSGSYYCACPTTPIPSVSLIPTPNCICINSANNSVCDSMNCVFKELDGVPYIQPKKCSLSLNLFPTPPIQNNRNSWCQRPYRTLGDADGNGVVEKVDYYYYVAAVNGGKIPATVNPDFNGDGEVGVTDREIVLKTLSVP